MSSNTYKWIIGCLIGVIIVLGAFLVAQENKVISVSFSECLSVAATLSSLILSVIAMFYTYFSGRDTMGVSEQIKETLREVNRQVQQVSDDTKKNSEMLARIKEGIGELEKGLGASETALEIIRNAPLSDQERQSAIDNVEKSHNSMVMFLKRMRETD